MLPVPTQALRARATWAARRKRCLGWGRGHEAAEHLLGSAPEAPHIPLPPDSRRQPTLTAGPWQHPHTTKGPDPKAGSNGPRNTQRFWELRGPCHLRS